MRRTPLRRRVPLRRCTRLLAYRTLRAPYIGDSGHRAQSRPLRWIVRPCRTCRALVMRPWHRRHKPAFCCRTCAAAYYSGTRHPQYRHDPLPPLPANWKARAERVRKRDGYRCRDCGKTQQENGRKLHVDHVWPRRWFSDPTHADDERNLLARCASCHSKKTAGAERELLRGDLLAFRRYTTLQASRRVGRDPAPPLCRLRARRSRPQLFWMEADHCMCERCRRIARNRRRTAESRNSLLQVRAEVPGLKE